MTKIVTYISENKEKKTRSMNYTRESFALLIMIMMLVFQNHFKEIILWLSKSKVPDHRNFTIENFLFGYVSFIVSSPPFLKGGEKFENVLKGGVEEFHLERGKISGRGRNN